MTNCFEMPLHPRFPHLHTWILSHLHHTSHGKTFHSLPVLLTSARDIHLSFWLPTASIGALLFSVQSLQRPPVKFSHRKQVFLLQSLEPSVLYLKTRYYNEVYRVLEGHNLLKLSPHFTITSQFSLLPSLVQCYENLTELLCLVFGGVHCGQIIKQS